MKRAGISITSNIAEGFSRKTPREKIQFYYISLGSLTELESQLILAKYLNYITSGKLLQIQPVLEQVNKLINGLIKNQKNT